MPIPRTTKAKIPATVRTVHRSPFYQALHAVAKTHSDYKYDRRTVIVDMLADLRHLADKLCPDVAWEGIEHSAANHYDAEKAGIE